MEKSRTEKVLFFVLLAASLLLMTIYILESRIYNPFNFIQTYAGYRPSMKVHIAPASWCLFTGVLFLSFALALAAPSSFFRRLHESFMHMKGRYFLFTAVLLAFVLSSLVNFLVYGNIPKNLDEIGYLFQAHHFAAGRLFSRAPLEGFHGFMNIVTDKEGKIYGAHFPGMSLLQAPAVFLGQPWITGPFLGAFGLLVLFGLVKRIYNDVLARYTVIFALISPFYIFMNGTFLSHPGSAFFTLLFCYFFTQWICDGKKHAPYLTGLFLGLLAVTRPLTCLAVTFPFFIHLAVILIKRRSEMIVPMVKFLLPVLIIMGLFAGYVKALTGDPFLLPTKIQNPSFSPGFGPQQGIPVRGGKREAFYFRDGVNQMISKTIMLGVDLYGWGGFSLIFIPFVLAAPDKNRWDFLFLTACVLISLNYLVTPAKGMVFGPRYFFAAVPFLFILTARGIQGAATFLSRLHKKSERAGIYRYCIHAMAICVFFLSISCVLEYIPMKVNHDINIHPRFLLDFNKIKF